MHAPPHSSVGASEIPFFFAAGYVVKRVGFFAVLLICSACCFEDNGGHVPLKCSAHLSPLPPLLPVLAFAVRVLLYTVLTDPWWALPIELFHGITYALNWAASTEYGEHCSKTRAWSVAPG